MIRTKLFTLSSVLLLAVSTGASTVANADSAYSWHGGHHITRHVSIDKLKAKKHKKSKNKYKITTKKNKKTHKVTNVVNTSNSDASAQENNAMQNALNVLASGTAPLETTSTGHPIYQPLHNGNEVYVYINTDNSALATAYRAAMQDWNNLGVIKFVEVNDAASANVTANGLADRNMANAFTNIPYDNSTGQMAQSSIYFTSTGLNTDTPTQLQVTARHELGHAIGFDHDPLTQTVDGQVVTETMYGGDAQGYDDTNVRAPLSQRNVNALHEIYDTQINAAAAQNNNN